MCSLVDRLAFKSIEKVKERDSNKAGNTKQFFKFISELCCFICQSIYIYRYFDE